MKAGNRKEFWITESKANSADTKPFSLCGQSVGCRATTGQKADHKNRGASPATKILPCCSFAIVAKTGAVSERESASMRVLQQLDYLISQLLHFAVVGRKLQRTHS